MSKKENIWEEFDKSVDIDGLQKDIKEAEENGGQNMKEVPLGTYEIRIEKLELVKSKKNDPMFTCWMKIVTGEYKGCFIFMNQVMTQGFQIHIVRSLDSGIEVEFKTYSQFAQLLDEIKEKIDGVLEYGVEYGEKKGFNTFKITDVFEVEE